MSIATAIVEAVTRRIAPDVGQKLEAARAKLTALEGQQGKLALNVELGEDGAAAKFKEWQKAVEVARAERDRLEAAHEVARRRDHAAAAAADAAARREQFNRLEQHAARAREGGWQAECGARCRVCVVRGFSRKHPSDGWRVAERV
jgi:hypothetical protein